jgi:N-acetylglucosamine-6-phosphate deacetylase
MDFNSTPLDEEIVWRVTRALWREGVTTYYPTIITNYDEAIEGAVRTIARARLRDGLVESSVAGIHLEGPFISPEDGPRGAHAPGQGMRTTFRGGACGSFGSWCP